MSYEQTAAALKNAKALIDTPAKWTQDFYAKTAEGDCVRGNAPEAVCFCALGALESATGVEHLTKHWDDKAEGFLKAAAMEKGCAGSVASYNDSRKHEEVMALFDRAIQLAEQKAG